MTARLSVDDLSFIHMWVDAYEDDEDEEINASRQRILAWAQAEITKREAKVREDKLVKQMALAYPHRTITEVRFIVRKHLAQQS